MANSYPTSLNNYATGASSETLVSAGHASEHNALETKLGTGASTPVANTVLRGTGTGSTAYGQVVLTTDVTGVLPGANGGTGKVTLTQPATGSTLTILDGKTLTADNSITIAGVDGKTLTVNNSITLAGTDATTMTFPSTSDTVVTLAATQTLTNKTLTSPVISSITNTGTLTLPTSTDTLVGRATTDTLTNKRRTRRVVTVTQSATPAIDSDNMDVASITGLAQAITSMTSGLTGTPVAGDLLEIQITDNGTARAITWGTSFESTTVTLPTTTVVSTMLRVLLEWNATASKWDCVAVA